MEERKREKEERLGKEVEKARAREGGVGVELDDVDPELEMGNASARMSGMAGKRMSGGEGGGEEGGSGDESGDDGYYELGKRQTKEKKDKKSKE